MNQGARQYLSPPECCRQASLPLCTYATCTRDLIRRTVTNSVIGFGGKEMYTRIIWRGEKGDEMTEADEKKTDEEEKRFPTNQSSRILSNRTHKETFHLDPEQRFRSQ